MTHNHNTYSGSERLMVLERDVDAAMIDSLNANFTFADWVITTITGKIKRHLHFNGIVANQQVQHVFVPGTTDIYLTLLRDGRRVADFLIENKIDAPFTPEQPHRYHEECRHLMASGTTPFAASVLFCPANYREGSSLAAMFDAHLSYEDVRLRVDQAARRLIEAALERYNKPYEPVPDSAVGIFHMEYGELCRRRYGQELVVKPCPNTGGRRPRDSRTVYYDVRKTLPLYRFLPTVKFSHQCQDKGYRPSVKIMIGGWAPYVSIIRLLAERDLYGTPYYVRNAGKRSLGIVVDTPRLDNTRSVAEQLSAVMRGIDAAASLRAWFMANEGVLRRWADAAVIAG